MTWNVGDRVKVLPTHYGTGLQNRLGTVLRVVDDHRVEVEMDSFYLAGIGLVTFKNEDLTATKKKGKKKFYRTLTDEQARELEDYATEKVLSGYVGDD